MAAVCAVQISATEALSGSYFLSCSSKIFSSESELDMSCGNMLSLNLVSLSLSSSWAPRA